MTMRTEYPRPQFVRKDWQCLNGTWQFAYDDTDAGLHQGWYTDEPLFPMEIQVPFAYQAQLSGIGDRTPHDVVWYKRYFTVEGDITDKQVLLHFGAVDYEAKVFVNGHLAGEHTGGHTPFTVDITHFLVEGEQLLAVRARDPHKDEELPRGKQFWEDESAGIWYTNTTGIWQTVWIETVPVKRIERARFTSLFDAGKENFCCEGRNVTCEDALEYEITYSGELIAKGRLNWCTDTLDWDVDLIQKHIFRTNFHNPGYSWTPEHPALFDVRLRLIDGLGACVDEVESYFGFRKIHIENHMVYLNNRPYYQKLVLDQGYWRKGLLTAPSDVDFKKDIALAKEMGFNGCRKHQKMEDPRFLYWADKMGFLVWGECGAATVFTDKAVNRLMKEWAEVVERDYNHPCIVVWVPLNESWGIPQVHADRQQQHFSQAMYHYLHALDDTRLVVSNDGWEATETDICSIHNYSHGQKEEFKRYEEYVQTLSTRDTLLSMPPCGFDIYARGFSNQGEPILLTEYGGIGYDVSGVPGWGYTSVSSQEEFIEDYSRIMKAVLGSKGLWGFCYTQLYDVEQEINGMLTYDREPKCDLQKIREINEGYHCSPIRTEWDQNSVL